ncbi:hypothetical protein CFOL_v3_32342 [Cephalotus follicularis]|uniref:DUF4283 domain-containing protein n=1 Tax=Cephalotus follicularis TaxID=3775 RepID=A0A1Q3D901_CEPFO|nr:hypothetical protein CFOL_v3_32342 [Cephalotus follicularis]
MHSSRKNIIHSNPTFLFDHYWSPSSLPPWQTLHRRWGCLLLHCHPPSLNLPHHPPPSLPPTHPSPPLSLPAPLDKASYHSALGRPASSPYIPLSQQPAIPKIPLNPKSPSSINGKPLLNLSPTDFKLTAAYHSLNLIAKFSTSRPHFEHHINTSWSLGLPAVVGLLDPKHICIHLQTKADFTTAWSRESRSFDNRRYLL